MEWWLRASIAEVSTSLELEWLVHLLSILMNDIKAPVKAMKASCSASHEVGSITAPGAFNVGGIRPSSPPHRRSQ